MAEFIGGHESAAERILHARRHADLALERLVPALGLGLDLPLEVIDLDLELTQDGLDHVAVGQRQQQMFGIHLGAAKFGSVFGGLLQQGFRLFADAAGQTTAATARRTRTCGGGLAERGIDHVIGIGGHRRRVVADAEEVTAEEVLEQAAARAEQGFQRRDGALLLAHQLTVMVVTQQHGAVTTVEIGFHPHGGGLAADLALFSVHADAPVKIDLTRHRRSRCFISFCFLRKTRCPASAVDRDRAPLLGRTGLALFHRDREHAVFESGLDRVLVGIGRQVQRALKAAVGALHPVETAVFRFLLLTLFTAHQQHVVVERDLDVFFLDAGYFQGDLVLLVGLLDVQRRLQHARPVRLPAWHGQRRETEASKRVVEQAVDLAMQLQDGTDGPTRHLQVIALHWQR
ncbi:hypothetical protein J813_3960, partial [Acinetobacter sp. 25977_10]